MKSYDCAVIGGGPGGCRAARLLAARGKSVCLIEARLLGGTCLNRGCIPVKFLLESARLLHGWERAERFGLAGGPVSADPARMAAGARAVVDRLRAGLARSLETAGVETIFGRAEFAEPGRLRIVREGQGDTVIAAAAVVIAAGSAPAQLPGVPTDGETVLDSDALLERFPSIPRLLVAGGGYIGCEFASLYAALGSRVVVAEAADRILPGEDADVSRALARGMDGNGIEVLCGRALLSAAPGVGLAKAVLGVSGGGEDEREFDRVLVAAGRAPGTRGLGLEAIGLVPVDGFVPVDGRMETAVAGVFAVGDVVPSPMLAHVAEAEATAAAAAVAGGAASAPDYNLVPRTVFSFPEVGAVGLTEAAAEAAGIETGVRKRYFKANAKAVIAGEEDGFAKLVFDRASGKLLGAAVVGAGATESIQTVVPALAAGMTKAAFGNVIRAHPTLAEVWG
ncbi:MAG TPA: NAD(P)/FAD-dependent oxidoreductase [bacterium]|nr:NAD(P)/FAD-dependent oxidoreductase [bacterium]